MGLEGPNTFGSEGPNAFQTGRRCLGSLGDVSQTSRGHLRQIVARYHPSGSPRQSEALEKVESPAAPNALSSGSHVAGKSELAESVI